MTAATSSLGNRPGQTRASPAVHFRTDIDALAPPLPPKPAVARGPSISHPPPLPPKPSSARAPRVGDQHSRPVRPLPVPLIHHGHETPTPPPLPSAAKPPRHRRYPSESTQDVTGTLPSSSSSSFPLHTSGFHPAVGRREDPLPPAHSIPIPFPPPLGLLREAGFSQLFARVRTDSKDVLFSRQAHAEGKDRGCQSLTSSGTAISIPKTMEVDAEFGAAAIANQRKRDVFAVPRTADVTLSCPALCGGYPGSQPGGELWSVVDEVVNASKCSGRAWSMAMKVLVGMIITATVDSFDSGYGLCSEVVRRMRERSPTLGAEIFTLLTNLGAQAVFAGTQWHDVEQMVLSVFSNVVEHESQRCPFEPSVSAGLSSYRGCTADSDTYRVDGDFFSDASGCQVHRLFWERAAKCGIALLGSRARVGNIAVAVRSSSSPHWNSARTKETASCMPPRQSEVARPAISLRALIALSQRIPLSMHPSVERVLVGDGIWRGFRGSFDEDDDVLRSQLDEDRLYTAFGGLRVIVGLYVRCRSLVARRRMFVLIAEVAVGRVSTRGRSLGGEDVPQCDDSVNEFFSVLRAYDAGDALVAAFKLGPEPSFVMDILRHTLFDPLSCETPLSTMLSTAGPGAKKIADATLLERRGCRPFFLGPNTCGSASGPPNGKNCSVTKELLMATFVANEVLHKRFALGVLMHLEEMARSFSRERSKYRESGGEVCISEKVEIKIAELRRKGMSHSPRSVRHVWHSINEVLSGHLAGAHLSDADVALVFELMLSVTLVPLPFTKVSNDFCDSEGAAFLHGERRLLSRTSSKDCGDLIVGLLHVSAPFVRSRYVSELRQSFVEILGASTAHAHRLMQFTDDPDALVAFRSRKFVADSDFNLS